MITSSLKTKLALVVTILLWASAFPAIRAGLIGYTPGALGLLRFLVASICLFIIYIQSNRTHKVSVRDAILLIILGGFALGGYHIALNIGEQTVQSGVASFIISLSTIFTILFAVIFLNEKINKNIVWSIILCIIGVGLMTLTGNLHAMHFELGIFFVLFSAFAGGVYSVLQKPFLVKYSAIDVTAYIIWGATLFLMIFSTDLFHEIGGAALSATISAIYLGIFPAAIAYLLWSYALAEIPASKASISLYFLPIGATLIGWVWLDEIPSIFSLVGGLIILAGVWLSTQYRANAKTL